MSRVLIGAVSALASLCLGDARTGSWGAVVQWPIIPIHMVLTPGGKVVAFGSTTDGKQGAQLYYAIWDPALGTGPGSVKMLPNPTSTDIFCAAQILLPSGKALVVGGDDGYGGTAGNSKTTFIDGDNEVMSNAGFTMAYPRWYPSVVTLPNGEILVQGGKGDGWPDTYMTTPEIFNPNTGWRSLLGAMSEYAYGAYMDKWWYPRSWVLPDGRVFGIAGDAMYFLDWTGDGRIDPAGTFAGLNRGKTSSTVMYAPGKFLQIGGGRTAKAFVPGIRDASLIDVTGASPIISPAAPMNYPRHWGNTTLLADGTVLVTGGSDIINNLSGGGPSLRPELWDPATDSWRVMAPEIYPRLYHSTALLLPDGTVLSAGGGAYGPVDNFNGQIFYPPYLFDGDTLAARPVIEAAGQEIEYGGRYAIRVRSSLPIARVGFRKMGAATHSVNNEQRFLDLPFRREGARLTAMIPSSPNIATPGYYLVFAIDSKGVPSVGKVVRLSLPAKRGGKNADTDALVQDGSFESAALPKRGKAGPGAMRMSGNWKVEAGSVSIVDPDEGGAGLGEYGSKCLALDGSAPASISQTLHGLEPGAGYSLTFAYARRGAEGAPARASVQIGGMRKDWTASAGGLWMRAEYVFVAESSDQDLRFLSGGPGADMLLDDVAAFKTFAAPPDPLVDLYPWRAGAGGWETDQGYDWIAASPKQNLRGTFTLAARVRPGDFQDNDGIIVKGTTGSPYALRVMADGSLDFAANRGAVAGAVGGGEWHSRFALKTDRWQHVAVTYDGAKVRFYLDGVPDSAGYPAAFSLGTTRDPLILGRDVPARGRDFNGALADVQIYDQALPVEALRLLANVPGTLPGDAALDMLPWNGGNGAVPFDGATQFLQAPDGPALHAARALTLAARVNVSSFGHRAAIIAKGSTAMPYALELWDNHSLRFEANYNAPAGGKEGAGWNSSTSLVEGAWHHVAVTFDGTRIRFYVDGTPDDYQPAVGLVFGANDEPLFIGKSFADSGAFFHGSLADVKVFPRALTNAEIMALAGLDTASRPSLALSKTKPKSIQSAPVIPLPRVPSVPARSQPAPLPIPSLPRGLPALPPPTLQLKPQPGPASPPRPILAPKNEPANR